MTLDQTANFLRATLASAISSGDTTIALADSGQLVDPANGEYNLVVWDPASYPRPGQDPAVEIVRATALDSGANSLTVDRGQEGTSAADHPVEAVLQLSPTAKMFSDIDAKTAALSADGQTFAGDAIDVGSVTTGEASIGEVIASASFTADQTIPQSTSTKLNFDNEIEDEFDTYDPAAAEFTVPYDGEYLFIVRLAVQRTSTTFPITFTCQLVVNGSYETYAGITVDYDGTIAAEPTAEKVDAVKLSQGDVVHISLNQALESSVSLTGGAGLNRLSITRQG